MPHKGFFTQGAVVLTERPLSADAVDEALRPFNVVKRTPAEGEKNWISGYPTWVISWRPEVNGNVTVEAPVFGKGNEGRRGGRAFDFVRGGLGGEGRD